MLMKAEQSAAKSAEKSVRSVDLQGGKLPPQALELEAAVLGALMIDKRGLDEVIDILTPEVFYKDSHRAVFTAIRDLFEANEPVDLLTVADVLKKKGLLEAVGGEYYLVQLTNRVSSSAHIEHHTYLILQKYILRKLIAVSSEIIAEAYRDETDVVDLLDSAENKLFEITNGNLKKGFESSDSLVRQAIERIEKMGKQKGLTGVPSGFEQVDKITGGWQPSDLVILAARPGMGKTAFMLTMARNIAIESAKPVAIFSLEMSSVQLIMRLISSETGLSSEKLRKGDLADYEWEQLHHEIKGLQNAPIFIDDTPALSIFELRAKCRRLISQQKVQLIIVDYLQLMTMGASKSKAGNREQEISTISRNLKSIAKELSVPVIALSQLSRAVETRGGTKRPQLSDLRESGAIEQDADIVSFIYRPEYYNILEWDDDEASPAQNQAELIIAKHRNGKTANVRLQFISEMALFKDLEEGLGTALMYNSSMNADAAPSSPDGAPPPPAPGPEDGIGELPF